MWQKRQRSRDIEAPPAQRLRSQLVDLYGSGELAADRTQELVEDAGDLAVEAGRPDFEDLRSRGMAGSAKNASRDMRRRLLKRSFWPPLYEAEVRMWVPREKAMKQRKVAFLLPHELVFVLASAGSLDTMVSTEGLDDYNKEKHAQIMDQLQVPFVGMSLWGDGVPYSWDRKKAVDVWTLSFPGLSSKAHRDLRLTLTAIPHEGVCRETQDDILTIFAWSFAALAFGTCPTARHDGSGWEVGDSWRKKHSGEKVVHGALLEVKGDWKQLLFCFGIPGWMSKAEKPFCWRCKASKLSLKTESGHEASWLQEAGRLSHFECLHRILLPLVVDSLDDNQCS